MLPFFPRSAHFIRSLRCPCIVCHRVHSPRRPTLPLPARRWSCTPTLPILGHQSHLCPVFLCCLSHLSVVLLAWPVRFSAWHTWPTRLARFSAHLAILSAWPVCPLVSSFTFTSRCLICLLRPPPPIWRLSRPLRLSALPVFCCLLHPSHFACRVSLSGSTYVVHITSMLIAMSCHPSSLR